MDNTEDTPTLFQFRSIEISKLADSHFSVKTQTNHYHITNSQLIPWVIAKDASLLFTSVVLTTLLGLLFSICAILGFVISPAPESLGLTDIAYESATGFHRSAGEILAHNAQILILSAVGGILFAPPLIIVIINGIHIGIGVGILIKEYGVQGLLVIAPHGLLEIPAILLACAAGLRLYMLVAQYLSLDADERGDCIDLSTNDYAESPLFTLRGTLYEVGIMVGISLVLLTLAAIIEDTVTLEILRETLVK